MTDPGWMKEISDDELSELLSSQPKKSQTRESQYTTEGKTGKAKKVKFSFDDRTYRGWFNLMHNYAQCEIESHDETHERGALCATLPDGRKCCRRCYLAELDKV